MEMRVFIAEHKQEIFREKSGARQNDQAKRNRATNYGGVEPPELSWIMAPGECRDKNVSQQITEHSEDHGQATERSDLGD